ncbi:MAG: OmpA family protein [Deltaproteobacteria bacterium]|nr:OmpA family protein [Deltaproteobacteria bacterium]
MSPVIPVAGWQKSELGPGINASVKFELAFKRWMGVELGVGNMTFFNGSHPAGYENIGNTGMWTGGGGLRFRLLNDDSGYKFPWGKKNNHTGNLHGNLFLDIHALYVRTGDLNRLGGDAGLGYEFSLVNGLQFGPFARFTYVYQPDSINRRDSMDGFFVAAGLSISFDIPPEIKIMEDSDGDGFYDPVDACPNDAEDFDNFKDEDGCPDVDNDGDKVLDSDDKCIDVPEDLDGFEDEDGCPEDDNDGDKILDKDDKCPDEAEDFDEFEDEDGCPDADNDGDGFWDSEDNCPLEPETINGIDDEDGCPDKEKALVVVDKRSILGGENIYFEFGLARVKSSSHPLLKEMTQLLNSHKEYAVITIEGFTDNIGSSEFNEKLSIWRGESVKRALVKLGVDPGRLKVVGHGELDPASTIRNEESRALNRRVEFYIEKIDETLAARALKKETETTEVTK